MAEIVVALIHLAGDVLVAAVIVAGFGAVLVAWLIPLIVAHPVLMIVIMLTAAGAAKARS